MPGKYKPKVHLEWPTESQEALCGTRPVLTADYHAVTCITCINMMFQYNINRRYDVSV